MVVLFGLAVGILFLEESHEDKKHRRDPGLELGKWILGKVHRSAPKRRIGEKRIHAEETLSFIPEDEQPPEYRSTEASPRLPCARPDSPEPSLHLLDSSSEASSQKSFCVSRVFTKQIMMNIVGYGILALYVHPYSVDLEKGASN